MCKSQNIRWEDDYPGDGQKTTGATSSMLKVGNPPIPTQVPNLTAPTGLADHKEWMGKSKGGDRHCVPVAQVSCPQRGQLCHAVIGLEVVVDLVVDK